MSASALPPKDTRVYASMCSLIRRNLPPLLGGQCPRDIERWHTRGGGHGAAGAAPDSCIAVKYFLPCCGPDASPATPEMRRCETPRVLLPGLAAQSRRSVTFELGWSHKPVIQQKACASQARDEAR